MCRTLLHSWCLSSECFWATTNHRLVTLTSVQSFKTERQQVPDFCFLSVTCSFFSCLPLRFLSEQEICGACLSRGSVGIRPEALSYWILLAAEPQTHAHRHTHSRCGKTLQVPYWNQTFLFFIARMAKLAGATLHDLSLSNQKEAPGNYIFSPLSLTASCKQNQS